MSCHKGAFAVYGFQVDRTQMRVRAVEHAATLARSYVRYAPRSMGKVNAAAQVNTYLRAHPRQRVARTCFGAVMRLDTQDLIQRYVYIFGVWEPHLTTWLRKRLRPGDTFIDIGANVGYYSLLAAGLVRDAGHVVAIEASPDFHTVLRDHVERNGYGNVRTVNAAVSDQTQELTFALASRRNQGANSLVPYDGSAESTFTMEARPLPDLLDQAEVTSARVLKIDVEGAEGAVMRSLYPVLGQLRQDVEIVVEVTPDRMARLGDSVTDLIETLRQHGFHTYRLDNSYRPESYPRALREPVAPVRWREPVTVESDLVFSRIDAETLT